MGLIRSTAELQQQLPQVAGREQGVAIPFQYLFTGEDNLRFTTVNVVAGVTLRIRGRWLGEHDAHVQTIGGDFFIDPSGTVETVSEIPLGKGVLLSLIARAVNAFVEPGQCFLRVEVTRGRGGSIVLGTLLSAYLGSWNGLAWPGTPLMTPADGPGWIHTVVGNTPPAGVTPAVAMPTATRWRVIAARTGLVSTVAAGNRNVALNVRQDLTSVYFAPTSMNQPPNVGVIHSWGAGTGKTEGTGVMAAEGVLPAGLVLNTPTSPNASLFVDCFGMNAGDQFEALAVLVEEWRNLRWSFVTP